MINAGVSGETSAGGLARIGRALTPTSTRHRRARRQRHAARHRPAGDPPQPRRHPRRDRPPRPAGDPRRACRRRRTTPTHRRKAFKAAFRDVAPSTARSTTAPSSPAWRRAAASPDHGADPARRHAPERRRASRRSSRTSGPWSSSSSRAGAVVTPRDACLRRHRAARAGALRPEAPAAGPAAAPAGAGREPAPDPRLPRRAPRPRCSSDVDMAFGAVAAPGFELALAGVDLFGGARPRMVYAGVAGQPGALPPPGQGRDRGAQRRRRGAGAALPAARHPRRGCRSGSTTASGSSGRSRRGRLRGAALRGRGLPPLPLALRRRRGLRGAGALPAGGSRTVSSGSA